MPEPVYLPPLSAAEYARARNEGIRRNTHDVAKGWKPKNETSPEQLREQDIIGACAELAVALYLGLPWTGEGRFGTAADVGDDVEVKFKRIRKDAPKDMLLILNYSNPAPRRYVSVIGYTAPYAIMGWERGEVIKVPRNFSRIFGGKQGAYVVHNRDLRSFDQWER